MITINFDKAKEITKARLRAERAPLLEAQDAAFQRALESGADTAAIVAEKQRLRDITKLADDAQTHDWLEGFLFAQAGPIYAGSNEIQRNIIAERVLGMPKS